MTATTDETQRHTPTSVRDRLIDAAEACLKAKGIRATTVSEVAEAAGVSRGWLYRHFPDKSALLGAALVRLNDAYWGEAHAMLEQIDGLTQQLAAGIQRGRRDFPYGLGFARLHQLAAGMAAARLALTAASHG